MAKTNGKVEQKAKELQAAIDESGLGLSIFVRMKDEQEESGLAKVAEAINRLADAYLYINQQEDEPSFEGQSLSDREPHL